MQRLSQGPSSHGDAPTWPVEAVHSDTRGFFFRCTGNTSQEPFPPASPFKSANCPEPALPGTWPTSPSLSARGPTGRVRVRHGGPALPKPGVCPGRLGFQPPVGARGSPRGPEEPAAGPQTPSTTPVTAVTEAGPGPGPPASRLPPVALSPHLGLRGSARRALPRPGFDPWVRKIPWRRAR